MKARLWKKTVRPR